MLKKKIWANFQRITELFTQKIVTNLSKYGFGIRDPGSGTKPIPDPGSGSATLIENTPQIFLSKEIQLPILCAGTLSVDLTLVYFDGWYLG
jgi:hypothetical protein